MTPRATYRLQFTADFRFADAAALAPYLASLGVSHVYASPIFAARPGSSHGYDVVDHNRLNPELGSDADFRAMAGAFHAHGLGLIADFVPNHMGIGGAANPCWLSVLEWGEASPFAAWFDIDWNSGYPGLAGKVLVPFLAAQYGEVLAGGGLELRFDPETGSFAVWAHDLHKLPICPRHYGRILLHAPGLEVLIARLRRDADADALKAGIAEAARRDGGAEAIARALAVFAGTPGDLASWRELDALIADQHWLPAKFSLDSDAINYRRFFTISDLAGLRVERPEVFAATHRLVLRLLDEGLIDGIRIDHIDGLLDPKAYALQLRHSASRPFYLLVEKILGPGEALPADWHADGTTGYEFANLVAGLLADPAGSDALTRAYAGFTGRITPPAAIVADAKRAVMSGPMATELDALAARLHDLARRDPRSRDFGRTALRAALTEIVAALDVYRTYADRGGIRPEDRARIAAAVAKAGRGPGSDPEIFGFLAAVLTLDLAAARPGDRDDIVAAAMRVQQFSGPVMAKGLEDAGLYRFNRLIALNEVGSEPGRFATDLDGFHRANADRLRRAPRTMLATSTHDTKRGEDARARIAAISGRPVLWREKVDEWHALLAPDAPGIDRNEAWLFYQLLLGAWPAEWDADAPASEALARLADRVQAAMLKSVREAGVNTAWVHGDPGYEAALAAFVARALDPAPENAFLLSFQSVAATLAADGAANALIQATLKLTLPGVPDIYQGAELWEQSLVDPDNRRPVDFGLRATMLRRLDDRRQPPAAADLPSGEVKLALTAALLRLRRDKPALFAQGSYAPLAAEGPGAARLCVFTRSLEGEALVVAAALQPRPDDWGGTCLTAPEAHAVWRNVLDGTQSRELRAQDLFAALPVAVLLGE